ncbi:TPA: hypothetical protein ACFNY2_000102 [Neisseria meningitidis]
MTDIIDQAAALEEKMRDYWLARHKEAAARRPRLPPVYRLPPRRRAAAEIQEVEMERFKPGNKTLEEFEDYGGALLKSSSLKRRPTTATRRLPFTRRCWNG